MASSLDYVQYVAQNLAFAGDVGFKKMFGEYLIYVNGKPTVLVCDNTAFVKMLPCLEGLMSGALRGFPYEGAKEHYIIDFEDEELTKKVVLELGKAIKK